MKILKGLLMIITAPVTLVLTLFVWLCTGLIYISQREPRNRPLSPRPTENRTPPGLSGG